MQTIFKSRIFYSYFSDGRLLVTWPTTGTLTLYTVILCESISCFRLQKISQLNVFLFSVLKKVVRFAPERANFIFTGNNNRINWWFSQRIECGTFCLNSEITPLLEVWNSHILCFFLVSFSRIFRIKTIYNEPNK
jgi:hypothetical protein